MQVAKKPGPPGAPEAEWEPQERQCPVQSQKEG